MDRKLACFQLPFFFLLLTSGVISEIEVNPQLQTNVSCSTGNDICDSDRSFCNSAGMCQCLFGYSPQMDKVDRTRCQQFECSSTAACSELYHDSNVICKHEYCGCPNGFRLNAQTQKCLLEKPTTRKLGARCVADHQCGHNAECTTDGECRCPAGSIPETVYTCVEPECSSNEFCHGNVTANTVCDGDRCRCLEPVFKQDPETFECVRVLPDTLPLGAHCANSTYCGKGADCTTGSKQICKCQLGFEATSETVCEVVRCTRDANCHKNVSPMTACVQQTRSYCECDRSRGYYENPHTFECSPIAPNLGEKCAPEGGDEVYRDECGSGAECNKEGNCKCRKGHVPINKSQCE